jgi:hypothetical protein
MDAQMTPRVGEVSCDGLQASRQRAIQRTNRIRHKNEAEFHRPIFLRPKAGRIEVVGVVRWQTRVLAFDGALATAADQHQQPLKPKDRQPIEVRGRRGRDTQRSQEERS